MKVDHQLRVIGKEILNEANGADTAVVMADLRRIGRWLGGHRVSRWALGRLRPPERFTIVDAGAASSGNGLALQERFPGAVVISLDRLASHLGEAGEHRVVADAFSLPFAPASVDYLYCSLFMHHFSDEEVVRLLESFARAARRGVVVVDLERHWLAGVFLPATRWLFRWHPITVHDARVSVRAGFTTRELEGLAARAGLVGASVKTHRPWFRLSLVWGRR